MRIVLCLCLPWAAGCAGLVDLPELPEEHPAHPEAVAAPATQPSGLLTAHHDVPGQQPEQSRMQHDHMQQEGHEKMRDSGPMIPPMQEHPMEHEHPRERQGMPPASTMQDSAMDATTDASAPPHIYLCPYHPTPIAIAPGQCMQCGRNFVHYVPQQQSQMQTYTCTMHPEVTASAPRLCPKCGMTLIPATKDGM